MNNSVNRDRSTSSRTVEHHEANGGLPLESSTPLESSAPLEGWDIDTVSTSTASAPAQPVATPTRQPMQEPLAVPEEFAVAPELEVLDQETIRLLEERLSVTSKRRKVGEVVFRKEIETRLVQVPVRREKLIIEQVSPETRTLAVLDMADGENDSIEVAEIASSQLSQPSVAGKFNTAAAASQFLAAIARHPQATYQNIEIKIVMDNPHLQSVYENWMQNFVANQPPKT